MVAYLVPGTVFICSGRDCPPQPRHSPVTQAGLAGAYWGFVSSSRTFGNCPEAWWDQHASFISLKVVLISITSFPGM